MIHAALRVLTDPHPPVADSRPLEGTFGFDVSNIRIDDMRAEALWKTAPWRAGLSTVCALVSAWAMAGNAPLPALAAWLGSVVLLNVMALRMHRGAVRYPLGAIGRSNLWVVGEAIVHAVVWGSLPALLFAHQVPQTQALLAAAMGTMIAGAFLVALAPVAAALWASILTGALMIGSHAAVSGQTPVLSLLLAAYLAVILCGCLTVERFISGYMETAGRERARRDAISALLREYEEQGVGWLWQIDASGSISYISPRLSHMLRRSTAQLIGQHARVVFGADARLGATIAARERFEALELQVPTPAGLRWISLSGNPIVDVSGAFHGYRGVGTDITDRHLYQQRLAQMAANDVLTGLPNRQRMNELIAEAVEASTAGGPPCAILYLDLDGFKPVNDTFGHPVGDGVLRSVAKRLSGAVGTRGQVGRVGGDEFALVLRDGTTPEEAARLGRTLIAAVSEPYSFDKGEVRIGLSIGCAFAPRDGDDVDELLLKADLALYVAKSSGRGTYRAFAPEMQRDAEERRHLQEELRHAIAARQLALHYQPVVDSVSGAIRGFEALVRWQHPERGLLAPASFLPAAEEAGLMAEIDGWVIDTACRDAATWPEPLFVTVNLSPRELQMPKLANNIGAALAISRLPPSRLELEISERRLPADATAVLGVLRRLRGLGIRLAIDEFGAGNASLGHIGGRLFDTLKIEGGCVREAGERQEMLSMVRAIVAVAQILDMKVVAGGVEQARDFARMSALGCHQIQGYLSGRPVPYDQATELVGTRRALGSLSA